MQRRSGMSASSNNRRRDGLVLAFCSEMIGYRKLVQEARECSSVATEGALAAWSEGGKKPPSVSD